MAMTRRAFSKLSIAGTVAIGALTSMGASCGSVFSAMLKYVGVGLQSFQAIIQLLEGAGALSLGAGTAVDLAIALVKAGFADLQIAVTNYNNAPASDKTTLAQKISLVLAQLEQSLQGFWNDLKIPDPQMASLVEGLLGIILSTLAGFGVGLPQPPAGSLKPKAFAKAIAITPQKRSVSQFKSDFNDALVKSGKAPVKF